MVQNTELNVFKVFKVVKIKTVQFKFLVVKSVKNVIFDVFQTP